ncbi:MAG: TCR/Tet family MFS transporter [Roseivirga sp.]|nr:TCR/Tet family MFS transporter [Roseivirga sp.]
MSKRTPALGFILVTVLIDVIGVGIIIPIIPDLLAELGIEDPGDASKMGGLLISSYAIMQFFFAPILGGLSDRYGRRLVILISLLGLTTDYLLTAFAPTLLWLFAGRIVAGIGGASFTTASAYIADISTPEKRAQNFGMIGAAFGVGFVIGPIIGGFLGEFGTRVPFFVAAGLSFANWIYGLFILPESLPVENRRKFDWKRANPLGTFINLMRYPKLITLFISFFIIYLAGHAVQSNWSFFGKEVYAWGPKQIGISLTLVGVSVAIVQAVLIKNAVKKFGQKKTVYYGLIFNFLGLILFSIATEEWMIYTFLPVYVLGGLAGATLQAIMSSQVSPTEQGELMGTFTGLQSLANILGPLMMTSVFSYYTRDVGVYFPGSAFALAAVLSLTSGLMIFFALKNKGLKLS